MKLIKKPNRLLNILFLIEKSKTLDLISHLHSLGIAEITQLDKANKIEDILQKTDLRRYEAINEKYMKFRDMMKQLELKINFEEDLNMDDYKDISDIELLMALESDNALFDTLIHYSNKKIELKRKIKELDEQIKELEHLQRTKINPYILDFKSFEVNLYEFEGKREELEKLLKEVIEKRKFVLKDNEIYGITIVEEKRDKQYVLGLNVEIEQNYNQKIKKINFKGFKNHQEIEKAYELKSLEKQNALDELTKTEYDLNQLLETNKKRLSWLSFHLECWKSRYNLLIQQKSTQNVDILMTWIDEKDYNEFTKTIKNNFSEDVITLVVNDSYHDENAPTKMENKGSITKNFEGMLKTVTIPSSIDLDPTVILTVLLPIMYGMIVGDVGYAIMSLPFAMFLKSKFKQSTTIQYLSNMWIFSAIFAFIFGLFYDEFFGLSFQNFMKIFNINVEKRPLQYIGIEFTLHRVHELPRLMGYTILFGAVIVSFGFLLGSILSLEHDFKHAVGKIAWIVFILSLLILLPKNLFNYVLIPMNGLENEIGIGLLVISVLTIFLTEGVPGIFELAGVVSNIMSFLRIAGVGVAGVIVAEIINASFIPSITGNLLNFFITSLVFLVLHFANAVIAMAEGMIQGGRLCLVEFGTKYFKGGGRLFNPFCLPAKKFRNA